MKLAIVVPGGLHPSGRDQVVPSWLALFERLAHSHDIHAFALKHLAQPQSYSLRGFTVHDLGRPSAPFGLTRRAQERALSRALDEHGPFDLIHGFHADPAGQLAARAGRRLGIPSVVTCDSGEFVALPSISIRITTHCSRKARGHRSLHLREQGACLHQLHGRTGGGTGRDGGSNSADVGHFERRGDNGTRITPRPGHVPHRAGGESQPREEPATADRCPADRSRHGERARRSDRRGHPQRRAAEARRQ